MQNVLTVIGARPQFIKAAMVSRALRAAGLREMIVHTGQHYDHNMSGKFFEELAIAPPDYNLGVGSGTHGVQTAEMIKGIESILLKEKPDVLLVYGDTNSTLAGALAASKIHIPVAHIEAGLRSFDRSMPEEINRFLTDAISQWLFCPTSEAVKNLSMEGLEKGVYEVGDVMYDAALFYKERAVKESRIVGDLGLHSNIFVLATIHRDFNTDNRAKLTEIVVGLLSLGMPVVFPAHPRVRKQLAQFKLIDKIKHSENLHCIEPVGYLDMLALECLATVIVTDSGGVQKEAFFQKTPCVTVRSSTEWVETVKLGWNRLVGADRNEIVEGVNRAVSGVHSDSSPYGTGESARMIADILTKSAD